jgi:hypothetical protein
LTSSFSSFWLNSEGQVLGVGIGPTYAAHIEADAALHCQQMSIQRRTYGKVISEKPALAGRCQRIAVLASGTKARRLAARGCTEEETSKAGWIGAMKLELELANILDRDVESSIRRVVQPILIIMLRLLIASIIVSILLGILFINDLALQFIL